MTRHTTDSDVPARPRSSGPVGPAVLRGHGRLRLAAFAVIALFVGGAAVGLVVSRLAGPSASDVSAVPMVASMAGFDPAALTVKAGSVVKIDLIDRDTSMHADGGGVHSFHIDSLNVHQKVQPESDLVFSFTAPTTPGTYDFYCDTCCGGKENPAMHGILTVTA